MVARRKKEQDTDVDTMVDSASAHVTESNELHDWSCGYDAQLLHAEEKTL